MDLEDSDEEEGLLSDVLNLLVNPTTSSVQPTASIHTPKVAPVAENITDQLADNSAEQPRTYQTSAAEPSIAKPSEPSRVEKATTNAEQTVSAEPPLVIEQPVATQNTPPPSSEGPQNASPLPYEDEGYGHRITLDSMIMTPRVPTLVEESTNIGTEGESKTLEETAKEFVANSFTSKKVAFMKQAGVTLI